MFSQNLYPITQKQECCRPSLQPSLRRNTLTFFATRLILLIFITINLSGQNASIIIPQPLTIQPNLNIGYPNTAINTPIYVNSTNPLEIYEQDKKAVVQNNPALHETLYMESANKMTIQYNLPSQLNVPGAEYFQLAFEELNKMLNSSETLNLKKAVFTVENAYFENQLDYQQFNNEIQNLVKIAQLKSIQDGYNWNNAQTKNVMLFRSMSDTLVIKLASEETTFTSYPLQYDFNDFTGKENWSNMFVSKLLATKSGQCHSLPLLYLILCEETGTDANLAFAPSHTYVKFKDQTGNWHNLELTNGHIVSDAYIIGSGYITSEAIKNRIYMEPLTKKQTIGQCLADLAKEYIKKYGYDSFVLQCVDSTLKYDPNNIFARQIKSDYQTVLFEYVVDQAGRPHPDTLKTKYSDIFKLLIERNQTYKQIDASGYQEMPEDAYLEWLNEVNKEKEKEKQENQNQRIRLTRNLNQ